MVNPYNAKAPRVGCARHAANIAPRLDAVKRAHSARAQIDGKSRRGAYYIIHLTNGLMDILKKLRVMKTIKFMRTAKYLHKPEWGQKQKRNSK